MEHRNAWLSYDEADLAKVEAFAADYKTFITKNKTERECAATAVSMARAAGYISIDEARAAGAVLKAGDKVYADCFGKSVILAQIGRRPMEEGLNILGAHIDSPRLDIKQNPLYEAGGFALLDTHYYGGIKKYQWVTLPLAIHGVIAKKDGSVVEVVPAGAARDCGFDKSMVIGYGHDDRVCAYPSLIAQLEASDLEKTGVCILVDKEEIGSVGATGMTSMFFENTIAEIMDLAGQAGDLPLRRCLANSSMLSSDVSAGFDPSYASAFEAKNAAYLGRGVVFNKFTGSRGKSGSNDANAEYMARIRVIMENGDAAFQTAELGKVDVGGGGTIAYILAKYGMNVIDCGVAVLNMHAPWEVVDKADLYETLKAYRAFLKWA